VKVKIIVVVIVNMADIVLSTAHKAKGLEFDTVRITDDYMTSDTGSTMQWCFVTN